MNTATRKLARIANTGKATLDEVKALQAQGARLTHRFKSKGDIGLLSWFVSQGQLDIANYLLEQGIPIDDVNAQGYSSLSYIIYTMLHYGRTDEEYNKYIRSIEWLMVNGANPRIPYSVQKMTVLDVVQKFVNEGVPPQNILVDVLEILTRQRV